MQLDHDIEEIQKCYKEYLNSNDSMEVSIEVIETSEEQLSKIDEE